MTIRTHNTIEPHKYRFQRAANKYFKVLFLSLIFMQHSSQVSGKEEAYRSLKTGSAISGATITIIDSHYNPSLPKEGQQIHNAVVLRVDHDKHPVNPIAVTVKFDISYTEDGAEKSIPNVQLSISYHPTITSDGSDQDRSSYIFANAHAVTVHNISVTNGTLSEAVILENIILTNRVYDLSSVPSISGITPLPQTGEYQVNWNAVDGAEEYQLEWQHVNNYYNDNYEKLSYDFRRNATRISTLHTSYKLSSLFEKGIVLFRVRAVTYADAAKTKVIAGKWSDADAGYVANYPGKKQVIDQDNIHSGDSLNWQYISNYAEEGKRKEVVSYYDGTMRAHQAVTRINSDSIAIVGETFYDRLGRSAIQTLPVPAETAVLDFHKDFNKNSQGATYSKADFDRQNGECGVLADSMSTVSGSSQYYSPQNPDKEGYNKFIPDAGKYPFSQTEYMPDNTGRIRRQGGVGASYQIGTTHETKYFYETPSQEELNRMFGAEVGWNTHYKKNITVDGNGQVSIAYVDMQDKIIASSLKSSESEDGVSEELTITVLNNYPGGEAAAQYLSSFSHVVTEKGDRRFHYYLPVPTFDSEGTLPPDICLDCVFDLTIDIVNECGERPAVSGYTLPINMTAGTVADFCTGKDIELDFTAENLEVGTYTIYRKLSLRRDVHTNTYIKYAADIKTFSEYVREQLETVDYSCDIITSCKEKCLGVDNVEDCIFECEYADECLSNEELLQADLMPGTFMPKDTLTDGPIVEDRFTGGQYALYKVENGIYKPYDENDALSIMNKIETVFKLLKNDTSFVDKNGEALQYRKNNDSINIRVFVENFDAGWVEALLPLHPEYNCLQECRNSDTESKRYDFRIRNAETFAEALAIGLLDPLDMKTYDNNSKQLPAGQLKDPYFQDPKNKNARITMENYMRTAVSHVSEEGTYQGSIWEVAVAAATHTDSIDFDYTNPDECIKDRVWDAFRALYLAKKAGLQSQTPCQVSIPEGKQRRFTTQADYLTQEEQAFLQNENLTEEDAIAMREESRVKLREAYAAQAEAQADNIMDELAICSSLQNTGLVWQAGTAEYDALRTAFVGIMTDAAVCINSVLGASDIPDSCYHSTVNQVYSPYKNFGEAMLDILNDTTVCSPMLISFPKKAGYDYPVIGGERKIDTCACAILLEADELEKSKLLPQGILSGRQYIADEYGWDIENYQAKVCLCKDAYGYGYEKEWTEAGIKMLAESYEYVPKDMNCDVCVDCNMLEAALDDFAEIHGEYTNLTQQGPLTLWEKRYRVLLRNYLDERFGQNKTYEDYMQFKVECDSIKAGAPHCELDPGALELQDLLNKIVRRQEITDPACTEDISKQIEKTRRSFGYRPTQADCCQAYMLNPRAATDNQSISLTMEGNTCGESLDCNIDLEFTDNEQEYAMRDIVSFTNIRMSDIENDTFGFYIDAELAMPNGETLTAEMYGQSCFAVKKCHNWYEISLCNKKEPVNIEDECERVTVTRVIESAKNIYRVYLDSIATAFEQSYVQKCKLERDTFEMTMKDTEHHFTLYYYDQAGNLIKTIPPEGVALIQDPALWQQIDKDRKAKTRKIFTQHRMATRYRYNSLNQLVAQYMPDHDAFDGKTAGQGSGLPANMDITSTQFSDVNNGILFGIDPADSSRSLVYTTADGGKTWSILKTSGIKNLHALSKVPNANILWAVGDAGTVVVSQNGGDWEQTLTDMPDLRGINMMAANTGYIIAANGEIYEKTGSSWSFAGNVDNNISLEKVYFENNSRGTAVGFDNTAFRGVIYESTDGGKSWLKQEQIALPKVTAMHMYGSSGGYIHCEGGLLLQTTDGGNTWKQSTHMQTPVAITNMRFFTQKWGIALDDKGMLLETQDGGYTWVETNLATNAVKITAIAVTAGTERGYAVSREESGNYLYRMVTLSGKKSWSKMSGEAPGVPAVIPGSQITGLYFRSSVPEEGYATNHDGKIYKTIDAGKTWTMLPDENGYTMSLGSSAPVHQIYEDPLNGSIFFVTANNNYSLVKMSYGIAFYSSSNYGGPYTCSTPADLIPVLLIFPIAIQM